MNYLRDRHSKRKKYLRWGGVVLALLLLFYFGSYVVGGFSGLGHAIFRPVIIVGNGIGNKFSSMGAYFSSKNNLLSENDRLKAELESMGARMANYNTVLDENEKLKETLGRKKEGQNLLLSSILSKPNQSAYDTLLIDRGTNHGVQVGQNVFASGSIPIGRVSEAYNNSATIVLYSSSGESTPAIVSGKDIFIDAVGRGGGSFEVLLPRDLVVDMGTEVTLPGVTPRVLGVIEKVVSSPRDAFQKVLMTSPVNLFELKFVEVEI